jgi:hypothetical protein
LIEDCHAGAFSRGANFCFTFNECRGTAKCKPALRKAVACSPQLRLELDTLVASKQLTEVRVVPAPIGGMNGSYENSTMLITDSLLKISGERSYGVMQSTQYVSLNQTAFILGYLATRLKAVEALNFKNFSNPFAYSDANLKNVASAFIGGWNASVDCAISSNSDAPLSIGQIGEMLFRLRYKFAFNLPADHPAQRQLFSPNGQIDLSETNISAIANHLKNSRVADLK